jgi:hypothetical protein
VTGVVRSGSVLPKMRAVVQYPRGWAVAVMVVIAGAGRPAVAQGVMIQGDAAANVGYTQTTRGTAQIDPTAQASDIQPDSVGAFFTEIRPGITLQTGSPRVTWRAGYVFSGSVSLTGERVAGYSNAANAALSAELTQSALLTVSAAGAQGGTSFLLSQRAADTGQPELRAPGNPNTVSGTLVESLTWGLRRHLSLQHNLVASTTAPQDALRDRNSAVTATLALESPYERDVFGVALNASVSWLRPLQADQRPYKSIASVLLGSWNHDFTLNWNGLVAAGIEEVYTGTGSRPLALLPNGAASLHYTMGDVGASIDFRHGTTSNLQVGTVALSDTLTARGNIVMDTRKARALSFSGGILHNQPIGESNALVAAGTGNAVQADAGFTTAITTSMLASLRYSLAYQFDQGGGIAPTLAHVVLLGVTASYRNTDKPVRPLTRHGHRVDSSDDVGFPVVEEPPTR